MPRFAAFRDDSALDPGLSAQSAFVPTSANPPRNARILIVSDMRLFSEALGLRLGQHRECPSSASSSVTPRWR